mmetsp:Transcript_37851/g.108529  ORF Transcript_37851/g.108529 Transcript_37851/m.108529 type:complete len:268 (+) Transcript_37851:68-871(+)
MQRRRHRVPGLRRLDGDDAVSEGPEGLLDGVHEVELACVLLGDHAVVDEGLPVDARLPELLADEDDRQLPLDLPGLHQRHQLKELVARAQAAGGDDETHALVAHPELPREEVVELEAKLRGHIRIQPILEGQRDSEADGRALRQPGALVRGLHHARAGSRADVVRLIPLLFPRSRPHRQFPGKLRGHVEHGDKERLFLHPLQSSLLAGVRGCFLGRLLGLLEGGLVGLLGLGAGGAEKHDDVVDLLLLKALARLLQLAHHPDLPSVV